MSYAQEQAYITSHFSNMWPAGVGVAYPNVKFDTNNIDEWVRLNIVRGVAYQASMGGDTNVYRHPGNVIVQVFVEPNSGAKRALELADTACAIWRGQQFDGLVFKAPVVIDLGIVAGWYQVNVSCPFYRDELF